MAEVVNLIPNPSAEVNDWGWEQLFSGGVVERVEGDAPVGRYYITTTSVAGNTNIGFYNSPFLVNGATYTLGFYARGNTTNSQITISQDNNTLEEIQVTSTWQFYTYTFTSIAAAPVATIAIAGASAGSTDIDGLILVEDSTDYGYFDGDTPNTSTHSYSWTGDPQKSQSVRQDIPVLDSLSFISNYQIDHIVFLAEGSITVPAEDFDTVTFDHGLPFTPLPLGEYSTSSTFDTSNSLGTNLGNDYFTHIGANSTSIEVELDNLSNGSLTLYLRVYGLLPSGIDPDVKPTAVNSDNIFLFHTKYNLDKIFKQGVESASSGQVITIPHNLGYLPKVRVWNVIFNRTEPLLSAYVGGGMPGDFSTIDETNLYLNCGQFGGTTFNYKIYADG